MPHARLSGMYQFWRYPARIALALAVMSAAVPAAPVRAEMELTASYTVTLAGITIGRADARSRFTRSGYAAVITGSTSGVSRLVSDARATLIGMGRFSPQGIAPVSYRLDTVESGFETHASMNFQAGAITKLQAMPKLPEARDRIPLTEQHKRDVVDPVGAFMIATDAPGLPAGEKVCNRTLKVFDGWQRYDVGLSYKETRQQDGAGEAYAGRTVICAARYIPVAGHRPARDAVKFMAENKRLEVWYVPIGQLPLLAPYRILIGTKFGDLVITSTRFVTTETKPAVGN